MNVDTHMTHGVHIYVSTSKHSRCPRRKMLECRAILQLLPLPISATLHEKYATLHFLTILHFSSGDTCAEERRLCLIARMAAERAIRGLRGDKGLKGAIRLYKAL